MIHEHHQAIYYSVPWYVIVVGVLVGLLVAVATILIAYQCYKRKRTVDEESIQINAKLHQSFNEYRSGNTGQESTNVSDRGWVQKLYEVRKNEKHLKSPSEEKKENQLENSLTESRKLPSPSEKESSLIEKYDNEKLSTKLGQLYFDVEFDTSKSVLKVTILKATSLPPKNNMSETADPYIKLHLLPEKKQRVKTRVLRKTLNPVYDEVFTFYGINSNEVQSLTLHFVVLSFDRYSRDEIIGEVLYPLIHTDLGVKDVPLCKNISPKHMKMHSGGRGEILLSMCYQPAANRLTVVILKARNLPKADVNGHSDPYVKVYLKSNGQRIDKKKSQVKKHTINPVFNQSFIFDIPANDGLQSMELEFQVLEWDRMTKNEIIGRVELGMRFDGTARKHWEEVVNCPRKQIAEWHKLKE